jgi:5-methylcytosine-specific restriction endonuclease McrA
LIICLVTQLLLINMSRRYSTRTRPPVDRYEPEIHVHRDSFSPEKRAKIRNFQGNKCNCGCQTPITQDNSQIDHINELVDGGSNERCNLQALYTPCHHKKTQNSRAMRRRRKKQLTDLSTSMANRSTSGLPRGCRYIRSTEIIHLPDDLRCVELFKKFPGYGLCRGSVTDRLEVIGVDKFIVTWDDGNTTSMDRVDIVKWVVIHS